MQQYTYSKNELENKIILVTGAGDGIGKAAALQFAELGATVILLGKTVSKLEVVYDEIIAKKGPEPAIVPLDLNGATPQNYIDMATTIEQQFGKLDGLLHNAGVLGHLGPFGQISEKQWNQTMQVNLNSQFFMTQALLGVLKMAPSASVLFTSSSVGRKGKAFWGAYAVSKFATEGMMQTLADEYENSSLRFNSINPGATRTTMREKAYPGEEQETLKTPAQIVKPYVYFMSEASREVSGTSLDAQPK